VSADDVDNWSNVVSLKVSLLLRSLNNNVLSGDQVLEFNGAPIKVADTKDGKTDRYLRRVFTSTISIRNRNIGY
jgi:type IV pilus assembly protein PilW